MADLSYIRAVNAVSYTVGTPPGDITYSFAAGEVVSSPWGSVTIDVPMQEDDPLILSGDIEILTQIKYIKCINEISYTNNATDYSYGIGEVVFNPASSVYSTRPMFQDDPFLVSGDVRIASASDFPRPPQINIYDNVFTSTTKPAPGSVVGQIYVSDWDVVATYFWYASETAGPQYLVHYADSSATHPTGV